MSQRPEPNAHTEPHPSLHPGEVAQICLDALQNNDLFPGDGNIREVYRFLTPEMKQGVGGLNVFAQLLYTPPYRPLIGFERAQPEALFMFGDFARQRVRVFNQRYGNTAYRFTLAHRRESADRLQWLIDSIIYEGK